MTGPVSACRSERNTSEGNGSIFGRQEQPLAYIPKSGWRSATDISKRDPVFPGDLWKVGVIGGPSINRPSFGGLVLKLIRILGI